MIAKGETKQTEAEVGPYGSKGKTKATDVKYFREIYATNS